VAAPDNSKKFEARFIIDPRRYSWCAVRCILKTPDNIRLAHSSPIYLPGKWDARGDAAYFVSWIDELIGHAMEDQKRFQNEEQRAQVLAIYGQARDVYRKIADLR
jgi:hypothetical protein